MTLLIVGLVVLLGVHSVRIYADGWRARQVARLGEGPWKALYSLASIIGLALVIWGFGIARADPVVVWNPPASMRHVAALLSVLAFILVAAAYVRGTRIKAAIGHPMVAGVGLWALGHLLANGGLRDVVLFGAFLVWAIVDFGVSRRRDRLAGVTYRANGISRDITAIVVGIAAALAFALYLHGPLIGVRPFG
jgi:uncharacterized membrane protein